MGRELANSSIEGPDDRRLHAGWRAGEEAEGGKENGVPTRGRWEERNGEQKGKENKRHLTL